MAISGEPVHKFVRIAHGAVVTREKPQPGDGLGMQESPQGKVAGRRRVWGGGATPGKSCRQEMGLGWRSHPREKLLAGDGFGVEETALLNLPGWRRGENCLIPSPSISLGSTGKPGAEQKESNDLVIAAALRV